MLTNHDVKQRFIVGKVGSNRNLESTGKSLLSYGWWEVAKWVDGEIVNRKGKSYSVTTAGKHRTDVHGRVSEVETPRDQGIMEAK